MCTFRQALAGTPLMLMQSMLLACKCTVICMSSWQFTSNSEWHLQWATSVQVFKRCTTIKVAVASAKSSLQSISIADCRISTKRS